VKHIAIRLVIILSSISYSTHCLALKYKKNQN
jgi:hypothetical protein